MAEKKVPEDECKLCADQAKSVKRKKILLDERTERTQSKVYVCPHCDRGIPNLGPTPEG